MGICSSLELPESTLSFVEGHQYRNQPEYALTALNANAIITVLPYKDLSHSFTVSILGTDRKTVHRVLVAAINDKARKLKNFFLLAQFSTKLDKFVIKFWEYLDTKSIIIHANIFSLLKMRKMLSSFKKQSQQTS